MFRSRSGFGHKPFQKRLERKPFGKRFYRKPPSSGVINRCNVCDQSGQCLRHNTYAEEG
ncbi:MAG TPA: hypothetical protein VGK06_14900 [Methanosarcina sp.]